MPEISDVLEDFNGVINVKDADYGAVGDGSANDTAAIQSAFDAAFGTTASPHGDTGKLANRPVLFPPGHYKITSPLMLPKVVGGRIFGSGRGVTRIQNFSTGSVFVSNGFAYSRVEGLWLKPGANGVGFDLDWDGESGGIALQSNTIADMFFEGGTHGCRVGVGGYMGSEILFQNNMWVSCTVAGLSLENYNAIANTVMGGNFQACEIGMLINSGNASAIGTGFQFNVDWDIAVNNSSGDTFTALGCRTESDNFLYAGNHCIAAVFGCMQNNLNNGKFIQASCGTVAASTSYDGSVNASGTPCSLSVRDSQFGRADAFQIDSAGFLSVQNSYYNGTLNGVGDTPIYVKDAFYTASGNNSPSMAAPTSGAWSRGDIVWNSQPSAGGTLGWVCVTAGSPGTWKAFGGIAA